MARHRPDRRRIKIHRTYSVEEAANTLGVSRGTVRRWLKSGLPPIDTRKPIIIRGVDLRGYLTARAKPKQPCPPGHCFCVKCRQSHVPDGGMAEYVVLTPTSGNLRALCPSCGSWMHRRTSIRQLEAIRTFLDVTTVERFPRLRDSAAPSTNEHLDGR
jgi:excisionase family DNA binding protein